MVQKVHSKMHSVAYTNTHHDVLDLVNHGMVKNTKTWICWKRNITFLINKKVLNLCLRWCILRSYHFLVEVTFNHYGLKFVASNPIPITNINAIYYQYVKVKPGWKISLTCGNHMPKTFFLVACGMP